MARASPTPAPSSAAARPSDLEGCRRAVLRRHQERHGGGRGHPVLQQGPGRGLRLPPQAGRSAGLEDALLPSAPWVGLLQDDAWLRYANHANRCARLLAELVADVPGASLMFPVEATGVFLQLSETAIERLRAWGWRFTPSSVPVVRASCAAGIPARVRELAADIRKAMAPRRPGASPSRSTEPQHFQ